MRACILSLLCVTPLLCRTIPFRLSRPAEVVAELRMRSPGSDWARPERAAAVVALRLEGKAPHYVTLYAGPEERTYAVFLGELGAGEHRLTLERDPKWSAPQSGFELDGVRFREYHPDDPDYPLVAYAPVVYAREDTLGRFSDVPLIAYCERLQEGGRRLLQFSMIFSNEDGGTSTRALMARWGRTTDIEYLYRVYLDGAGRAERTTIQTRDHKEVDFQGAREGLHPVLYVVTRNNMVAGEGPATLRYQLAPRLVDLSRASRELVMDEDPVLSRVAAQELRREDKLRPFGTVRGENISDPRNYLYLEMNLDLRNSAVAALIRLEGEDRWRSSNLGRTDYAISRPGWVRTTIELPPGTRPERIAEIGFQCLVMPQKTNGKELWPEAGLCRLQGVRRCFLPDEDYRPGRDVWATPAGWKPLEIPSGEIRVVRR